MSTNKSFFEEEEDEVRKFSIPESEIAKLKKDIRERNEFSLEETKTRNVLIVGRTRSGKSTAVGVLKDPCHEPKAMSIFSDTVDPKFQSFSLDNKQASTKYTLNIIDTPGLKEVKEVGVEARSDLAIMNTINYCLKNEITKINVLLIFISFELGITSDDLGAFQSFIEKFGHDNIKIGICVTRSEDKDRKWQMDIEGQLNKHAYFREVLKRPNICLCFIGCVDPQKATILSNVDDLKKIYVRVYNLRKKVLEIVFSAESQVSLLELPIAKAAADSLRDIFEMQSSILTFLENNTDMKTAQAQQKLADFALNVEAIMKSEGLLGDPNMFNAFATMRSRVKNLQAKMNEADFDILRGKIVV